MIDKLASQLLVFNVGTSKKGTNMRDIEDISELEGFEDLVMQDELVKYNILAANRGSEACMSPILPREGYKFISSDLCLHPDCEYLTPEGWVKVSEFKKGMLCFQVSKETLERDFIAPLRIIDREYEGDMIEYFTSFSIISVTKGHTMLNVGPKGDRREVFLAGQERGDIYFMSEDGPSKVVKLNRTSYKGKVYCVTVPKGFILIRSKGQTFVVGNCAGEPSLILNYTNDSFLYSILKGKGEAYIDNSGYFNSRSLYVSTLSKSALYNDVMNKEFISLWNKDEEQAKQRIKKIYKLSKIAVLSILYGAGIGNPHKNTGLFNLFKLNNAGIDFPTTKAIWYDFWGSIPDVAKFRDESVAYFTACKKKNKPAMNAFGFIIPSSEPHKAFNYIIQSSLSSWVRELLKRMNLMGILGPQGALSTLVCVVHDEIIVEVREEDIELYRKRFFEAVDATNNHFGLKYPMELGFNVGSNFYEIH